MGKKIEELAKASLRHIAPYVAGKPIEELQREKGLKRVIKLASNENPLGCSPKAAAAIRERAGHVGRYPDGSSFHLKNALADRLKVTPGNLIITSGSSEAIALPLEAFVNPGEEVIIPFPSFLIYKILLHKIGAEPVVVNLEKDFSYDLSQYLGRITPRTKAVILCSPNNPTGTVVYRKQLAEFLDKMPEDMLVLSDQAYEEYVETPEYGTAFPYLARKNVLVARTFSKMYGLAGLRIGYGVARKEIIEVLEKIRPPFNTTHLAQVAALAALEDQDFVQRSRENNRLGKAYLYREFSRLGIEYTPTEANFILVNMKRPGGPIISALEENGIILRPITAFGLPHNYLRITIGTPEENQALIENLGRILRS